MQAVIMSAVIFLFAACSPAPEKTDDAAPGKESAEEAAEEKEEEDTEEETVSVTIPASFLHFTGVDAQETADSYLDYCENAYVEEGNVILNLTEKQKEDIQEMNEDYIEEVLGELQETDEKYSCQLSDDYGSVTYTYDADIGQMLQAKLLLGVTSMHALNGMLENGGGNWNIEVTVVSSQTGETVGHGVLPGDEINFDMEELGREE